MQEVSGRMVIRQGGWYNTQRSGTGGIGTGLYYQRLEFTWVGHSHAACVVTTTGNTGGEFLVIVDWSESPIANRIKQIIQEKVIIL